MTMFRLSPFILGLVFSLAASPLLAASGPPQGPAESVSQPVDVLARWVQMVSYSVNNPECTELSVEDCFAARALVRAVISDPAGTVGCPALTVDGKSMTMHARGANPGRDRFPIRLCEAVVETRATSVAIAGKPLGFFPIEFPGDRMVAVGDTGCKDKKGNTCYELSSPDSDSNWGFPSVAKAAAIHGDASLILALGDYVYSTDCPSGQRCDTWDDWRIELFAPAAPLLEAAPWVLMRGNHEGCGVVGGDSEKDNGGDGWFAMLDPRSKCLGPGLEAPDCTGGPEPVTCSDGGAEVHVPRDYPSPYSVLIYFTDPGTGGTDRMILSGLDASGYPDEIDWCSKSACDPLSKKMQQAIDRQFAQLATAAWVEALPDTGAWLTSHPPLLYSKGAKPSKKLKLTTQSMQNAFAATALPGQYQLAIAGHKHVFGSLDPSRADDAGCPRIGQLVIGSGGVLRNKTKTAEFDDREVSNRQPYCADDELSGSNNNDDYGFVVLLPEASSTDAMGQAWKATFFGSSTPSQPETLTECKLEWSGQREVMRLQCQNRD